MAHDGPVWPGSHLDLGSTPTKDGTNFALYSDNAEAVDLCLFSQDGKQEAARIAMPAQTNGVWHCFLPGITAGQLYGYRVHGRYAPLEGHRFNPNKLLLDPYAKQLAGDFVLNDALFGFERTNPEADLSFDTRDSAPFVPKSVVVAPDTKSQPAVKPTVPWGQTLIYEAHVKGLTALNPNVPKKLRGTFEGVSHPKMLDHFTKLGVTSIELLPIHTTFSEPRLTEMGLSNYWGYNTINFFTASRHFMGPADTGSFRKMVDALHSAGIEVILDVVYNHTAESWELGPTLSMRGIDNASYYRLKENDPRYYSNETGCGNALNLDNPFVLRLVMDSLRFWANDMGVDGFRFDLATTLARTHGDFSNSSPFLTALGQDPLLSRVKLIAEPWDIGFGGYQVGAFPRQFSEWNDQYRDTTRRFWRGDDHTLQNMADALLGSASVFDHGDKQTHRSTNFITSHDGFTLQDVVSYNQRHNEANGEDNRDGHSENHSDNCGVEGASQNPEVLARRRRRKRNLLTTLMVSQGIPMLLAGDEMGHSQQGNNNAYCQDNETTWINWQALEPDTLEFTSKLIALRKKHPVLSRPAFLHGRDTSPSGLKDVTWFNRFGNEMTIEEWHDPHAHTIGLLLCGDAGSFLDEQGTPLRDETLLILLNSGDTAIDFELPLSGAWQLVLNTDAKDAFQALSVQSQVNLPAQSTLILTCDGTGIAKLDAAHSITELAHHYGILDGFHDLSGTYHATSLETKKALLQAMKVPLSTKAEMKTAKEQMQRELKAPLPKTIVAYAGEAASLSLELPRTLQTNPVTWKILTETGETRSGTIQFTSGSIHAPLSLPADLPTGYHTLEVAAATAWKSHLIVAPRAAKPLPLDARKWGLMVPLYGLKSRTNWGIGDFDDLGAMAEFAANGGADFVGINPLHALFSGAPEMISPYSPSSRLFLNTLHIAVHRIAELTETKQGQTQFAKLNAALGVTTARDAEFVDYTTVSSLKHSAFDDAFKLFDALPANHARKTEFAAYCTKKGEALHRHALYEALSDHFAAGAPDMLLWQNWPADYQNPDSETVAQFAAENTLAIRKYIYLQWLAETQLQDAQNRATQAGMSIGIYLDMAVGMVPGGAETWSTSTSIASGVSLGAPPDAASPAGQVWNLAPLNPHRLQETGYRHFAQTVRATMARCGLIRIDHILGISRSFWCPTDPQMDTQKDTRTAGAYVSYPLDHLIAVIALESERAGCTVVGEDLGTVPDGLRPKLAAANIYGCAVFYFEKHANGRFVSPDEYRAGTLASLSNHDFPTLAGYWAGEDFVWRTAMDIGAEPARLAADKAARERDKHDILAMLDAENLLPADFDRETGGYTMTPALMAAIHQLLGRTASALVACQIEDLLGLTGQPNVPGTTDEQPNWRRKIPVAIEDLGQKSEARDVMKALDEARRTTGKQNKK